MTRKSFIWNWTVPTLIAGAAIVACERAFSDPSGASLVFAFVLGAMLMLGLRRALLMAVNRYTLSSLRQLIGALEHGEDEDVRAAIAGAQRCLSDIDASLAADHNQAGWLRKRFPGKAVAAVEEVK